MWKAFAATSSTKPGSPDVTYTYRPSGQVQDRQFQGGPLVPVRYTIREQMQRIGDPATTTYPFSARYAYHANETVSESEFYSAGSPVRKRYRYVFGTSSYDALNRLKSADFSHYSGGWVTTAAHDLANIGYDAAGNLTALQRYRQNATLIDNLAYSYPGSSNRLSSVADAIATTSETWDDEDGSFTYDANGNMKTAPAPYSVSAVTYDHQNLPISLSGKSFVESVTSVDCADVGTAAVAGAVTGGLSALRTLGTGAKVAVTVATSVTEGATKAHTGSSRTDYDLADALIDAALPIGVGAGADEVAGSLRNTARGRALADDVQRAENIAAEGRPRPAQTRRAQAARTRLANYGRGPAAQTVQAAATGSAAAVLNEREPASANTQTTAPPVLRAVPEPPPPVVRRNPS